MKKLFLIVLFAMCALSVLVPLSVSAATTCSYSLTISPNPIAFGTQNPLTPSDPLAVTIYNNSIQYTSGGCSAITGITVSITGDMLGVFDIDSEDCDSLARGSSCTANLIFTPAAEGDNTATFNVNSTSPSLSRTASITGTGLIETANNSAALLALSQLNKDDSSGCDANAATGAAGKKSFGPAALGFIAVMGLVLGTVAVRRRIRKRD